MNEESREKGLFSAVILAAGFSSRMGRFKPLLPLGGRTPAARLAAVFFEAGVEDVIVVTGHRVEELEPAVRSAGARPVHNPEFRKGMFSSIQAGAAALPKEAAGFFIHPVDIPLLRPETPAALIAAFDPARFDVVYPVHNDRRGHPPLLGRNMRGRIREWPGDGGLRGLLAEGDIRSCNLPVPDPHVLKDMDTPEDYARLAREAEKVY